MARPAQARHPLVVTLFLAALLLAAASRDAAAAVVPVDLTARVADVRVAPGVKFRAWTFNGTVPGPVVRATVGDTVEVTLTNGDKKMWHSIDFHAAEIAPSLAFKSIAPGASFTFSFVADHPGVFMYHCGTSPMLEHIGMGMYGAIIVDPGGGRPPAREVTLVQSEFYGSVRKKRLRSSYAAIKSQSPKFVAFNGFAERYVRHPIKVPVGQPVRVYFVDAGPSLFSAFHVVGTIFDSYEHDGNPDEALHQVSTQVIPPGGGGVFELSFPEAGTYPFVSHSMRQMDLGAMGRFEAK
jgi:nitrite reductase (NO-forming)